MAASLASLEFLGLTEEHLEAVLRFTQQHFFPREPLVRCFRSWALGLILPELDFVMGHNWD